MQQATLIAILLASASVSARSQGAPAADPAAAPPASGTVASPGATINALTGQQISPPNQAAPNASGVIVTNNGTGPAGRAPALRPLTNTTTGARSNITPVQLQNINKLVVDLNALGLPSRDRSEQQRILQETLEAAPVAQVRPDSGSIGKLATALGSIVPGLNLTAPQRRQLAIDLNLAVNSGNLAPAEAQRVVEDVRTLLRASAVHNPQGVEQLVQTIRVLVSEVQTAMASGSAPTGATTAAPAGQGAGSQTGRGTGASPPESTPR